MDVKFEYRLSSSFSRGGTSLPTEVSQLERRWRLKDWPLMSRMLPTTQLQCLASKEVATFGHAGERDTRSNWRHLLPSDRCEARRANHRSERWFVWPSLRFGSLDTQVTALTPPTSHRPLISPPISLSLALSLSLDSRQTISRLRVDVSKLNFARS